jgi:predicted XRE-type DNA-binding protein
MSEHVEGIPITPCSGNIVTDPGFAEPEERLLKAELARRIDHAIKKRKLTQVQAAEIPGIDQPKVSALRRGRLTVFSIDRLLRFLVSLGNDVDIVVKEAPDRGARGRL